MDPREERVRLAILGGAVGLLLLAFVYQLVFIQITQGEAYKRKVTQGYTRTQTVVAARGQIVDRYGRPFTTNRISLDIILDRAYLPVGQENQVILELTGLLGSLGQDWNDSLPIGEPEIGEDGSAHYRFLEGMEAEVEALREALSLAPYATADDCMSWLCSGSYYGLEDWADDPAAQRKLAGVRYEMARQEKSKKYIIARKAPKLYMKNIISTEVTSITTAKKQMLYLDSDDMEAMRDKKVLIIDDVISTGESLRAVEKLVKRAGGKIVGKMAILAEGDAKYRDDIQYLAYLPLFNADGTPKTE